MRSLPLLDQQAQSIIDSFRVGKYRCHIWIKEHQVCAFTITRHVFPAYAFHFLEKSYSGRRSSSSSSIFFISFSLYIRCFTGADDIVRRMRFEWSEKKAAQNLLKHDNEDVVRIYRFLASQYDA